MDDCQSCWGMYVDYVKLDAQECTLGDLSNVLVQIHSRSYEEHKELEVKGRHRAKLRDITRVNCLRADSKSQCPTCVSWEGRSTLDTVEEPLGFPPLE